MIYRSYSLIFWNICGADARAWVASINSKSEKFSSNMSMEHVSGRKNGEILLYALSTCGWCGKTRELLTELGIEYSYVYVDLLSGAELDRTMAELARWNKSRSFPTLVINNSKVIVGFREDEIREVLA